MSGQSEARVILKDHKLSVTKVRLEVLQIFKDAGHKALTNQDIEDKLGKVDRITLYRTLRAFESAGLIHQAVDMAELDKISAASDLTMLAAGKGEIGKLIPRDPERSVYDRPQRYLTMGIVQGVEHPCGDRCDIHAVKFNFFADAGEYFWVPYTHKDHGPAWCWLMEAKPGSYLDVPAVVEMAPGPPAP